MSTTPTDLNGKKSIKVGKPRKFKERLSLSEQSKLLESMARGNSQSEIARILDRPQSLVNDYYKSFKAALMAREEVKDYSELKSQILEATEAKLIKSINDEQKVASATLRDCAYAFKEIYSAGRLERGLSTKNIQSAQIRVSLPSKPPAK